MKIVCLANSFKLKGRCLAGIELDENNDPMFENGRPIWIRPVCETEHGEVPNDIASQINLLDIIEFNNLKLTGHGHQVENVLIDPNSIKIRGKFSISNLAHITENKHFKLVFGNRGNAVSEQLLEGLGHSLIFLELADFNTNERIFENKPYPQIKLSFNFEGNSYNFPITDPAFLDAHKLNQHILQTQNKIYVSLSLAVIDKTWSSKLVAGIIY